jgi:hypothetical protein
VRVLVLSVLVIVAVVLVLAVLLRFAEEDPGNQVEHHSGDGDDGDGPGGMLEAAQVSRRPA